MDDQAGFKSILKIREGKKILIERDKFILSKGHGCLAYYSVLINEGFIDNKELISFEKSGSDLMGHPIINKNKGIEFSTGSLAMGLSIGVGLAIAKKIKKTKNKVYVVIGDGECNEGAIWESAMSAYKYNLDNVDVVAGGPPCQGFSNANQQRVIDDPRNELYKYFQY